MDKLKRWATEKEIENRIQSFVKITLCFIHACSNISSFITFFNFLLFYPSSCSNHWFCKYRKPFNGSLAVKKKPGHHPLSTQPEQQSNIQAEIRISLGRELTQFESDMLVHPRLCMTCLNGPQVWQIWAYISVIVIPVIKTNGILPYQVMIICRQLWLRVPGAIALRIVHLSTWKKIKNFMQRAVSIYAYL